MLAYQPPISIVNTLRDCLASAVGRAIGEDLMPGLFLSQTRGDIWWERSSGSRCATEGHGCLGTVLQESPELEPEMVTQQAYTASGC